MSKLSPYRKPTAAYGQQMSPINPYYNQNKTNDKGRRRTGPTEHTNKRYYQADQYPKLTEKKRYEHAGNINIEQLVEKNQGLASQNAELYAMLEERGKIIVALEQKLEQQVRAEMAALEAIDFEKARFVGESQRRFKDYERKIEELINEVYILNEERDRGNFLNAQQMNSLQETFNKEQLLHFQSIAQNQASAREHSEFERERAKALLDQKNSQMAEMALQFQMAGDKLRSEAVGLNNEIVHLNHMRKIELSEQKLLYEGMLEARAKEHLKEKELLILQHNITLKKLESQITALQNSLDQLQHHKQTEELQQGARELELIDHNQKLESELYEAEQFLRRTAFEENQRLKDLNRNQVKVLEASNEALVANLKAENARLIGIVQNKSQEIERLLGELQTLRGQQASEAAAQERTAEELKEKLRQAERDWAEEEERLKIKLAELREGDIRALKQFYEHEVEVLNQDLSEKTDLANKNRALLHEELHGKNQMRKKFDIEILKLNARIAELELRLNQVQTAKREELSSASDKAQITADLLLREGKEKEKASQVNEQQRRRLYELAAAKDREIEELSARLALIMRNHQAELMQKGEEAELLKKAKQDVEIELKKEKYFYDNELKKKDILLRSNADIYRNDIESLKAHQRAELELLTKEMATKINQLEVELNKYRALEKSLRNQIANLTSVRESESKTTSTHLQLEKERMENTRKDSLEKLERHYEAEIAKLNTEIADLKKQLAYKEEDLRAMSEKYHRLEQKLEMVMDSQEKLKAMESRIVALGQDNNLVKNFAEIIKTRAK